jgi:hypothetical protein
MFGDILLGWPEFALLWADDAAAGESQKKSGSVRVDCNL